MLGQSSQQATDISFRITHINVLLSKTFSTAKLNGHPELRNQKQARPCIMH